MAVTVPNPPATRRLYDTAKRVRDELGKGQEALRYAVTSIGPNNTTTEARKVLIVPDVDIILVGVRLIGGDGLAAGDNAELIALQDTDDVTVAAAAANRLIAQVTDPSLAEDIVLDAALLGLAGNLIQAGQPVVAGYTDAALADDTFLTFQVSYILADAVTSYSNG